MQNSMVEGGLFFMELLSLAWIRPWLPSVHYGIFQKELHGKGNAWRRTCLSTHLARHLSLGVVHPQTA